MLPVASPPLRDGVVGIRDGAVVAVGGAAEVAAVLPGTPLRDLGGVILAPGFVDAHAHLEWSLFGGLLDGPGGFGAWLSRLLGRPRPLPDGYPAAAARLGALRALASGTTTVADSGPTGAGVAALTEAGLRGVVHVEVFGSDPETARDRAEAVRDRARALAAEAGPRVTVGISPHAPYSAGPDLWRALRDAGLDAMPWATHVAESTDEVPAVAEGAGPVAEALAARGVAAARWPGEPGDGVVERLARAGALRPGLVAAHCVHVSPAEAGLLAAHGVAVAHCPVSNARLRCGRAPVEVLRAAGVTVALGSDSPASAGGYDMRAEARAARLVHGAAGVDGLSAADLVAMMTRDAARALGMGDRVGSLAPGMRADLVAVAPPAEAWPGDPHVALLDAGGRVTDVWVEGEAVLADGEPVTLDRGRVESDAAEVRRTLC